MNAFWAAIKLTRPDSSVLGFLSLFIPFYARTKDLQISVGRAMPLLFICACTFIANDLDDRERDQVNHPNRPLARGLLSPAVAALLYFLSLALALIFTWRFVDERIAFWYYALVTLSISYGYIVECLPNLKAPYVAAVVAVPLLIVAASYPYEKQLRVVPIAGFLFALGRELCMDIVDRPGDAASFMHRIRPQPLATAAFATHSVGLALLISHFHQLLAVGMVGLMTLVFVASCFCWFNLQKRKWAYRLMKLQLVVGLYFLT